MDFSPGGDPRGAGPGRGRGPPRGAADARFRLHLLSDLLTPWETILKRLELAAQGDFVIVLYNPKSKKRDWQLGAVQELLLRHKPPETPVGIVSRAMRQDQTVTITTLKDLTANPVDMQTVVIVGNSQTFAYGPYLVTPRGYLSKYRVTEAGREEG